jgi:hypothetical protein
MCSVTHVAAGALIGGLIGGRSLGFLGDGPLAFLIGFGSHIPMDMVPHMDFEDFRADGIVSVAILAAILIMTGPSPVLLGALGAVAPDVENLLWKLGIIREKHKIFPTHSGLLPHGRTVAIGSLSTEVAVSVGSAAVTFAAVLGLGGAN